ncbi:MAG: rod shape-determining protein RodA [Bacteroidaceae bacterium]|nr:rod shape-determining protein RodA [Bacteroidaceae bacterium]
MVNDQWVTVRDGKSIWKKIDWITIFIYLLLIAIGWLTVCGASYSFENADFFDFSTRAGKQFVWICCSFGIAFILMMLDDDLYDMFAYLLYAALIVLLIVTLVIAPETKGSRSWLNFGPVSLQPAEFAKFATALALSKFMSEYGFSMKNWKNASIIAALILVPMMIIVLQQETGSALVYASFLLVLYRMGMTGSILFSGLAATLFFVLGIRFNEDIIEGTTSIVGPFVVMLLIQLFVCALLVVYLQKWKSAFRLAGGSVLLILLAYLVSKYVVQFDIVYVEWGILAATVLYLLFLYLRDRKYTYLLIAVFAVLSVSFLYASSYLFNHFKPYQQARIQVTLGIKEDLSGVGYNVNQSKIAIGSGGLYGKGFLNGTQTKLKYVPEQDTDFIFCTIGEEQGFVGAASILILFLILIFRLITLAERQSTTFGLIYGYCVLSILLFHLFVNIGMVLGITPVIGIPLPFFSYGGSSLWGFTILLFIFLRIDAGRKG